MTENEEEYQKRIEELEAQLAALDLVASRATFIEAALRATSEEDALFYTRSARLLRAYHENVTINPQTPTENVPPLLAMSKPVHTVIDVDVFLPGCPPSADLIYTMLDDLLSGRVPEVAGSRFGR